MGGSESYQIRRYQKFERTYESLIKAHYKKDRQSKEKFEELVEKFLIELQTNPSPEGADQQSLPSKTTENGFELWKKRWRNLPGLRGAAKFGRLLYIVYRPKCLIYPFWIYTHQEYGEPKNQPPDKELEIEVKLIKEMAKNKENDAEIDENSVISLDVDI